MQTSAGESRKWDNGQGGTSKDLENVRRYNTEYNFNNDIPIRRQCSFQSLLLSFSFLVSGHSPIQLEFHSKEIHPPWEYIAVCTSLEE